MNPDEANTMAAIIAGMIASQVALSKFLIAEGVISQDALVAYLEKTVATLTPGVTDARSLMPLRNLISGIQMEQPTTAVQ
jgi:hypothetical protein